MSHITKMDCPITSRETAQRMCSLFPELFTFLDKRTCRYYAGKEEACDWALNVAGASYEVGFKWNKEKNSFDALVDWWASGGVGKALGGQEMPVLKKHYSVAKTVMEAERLGYHSAVAHMPDGKFKVLVTEKENKNKFQWKTALKKLSLGRILGGS